MRVLMFTVDPEKNEQDLVGKQKTLKFAEEMPEDITVIPVERPARPKEKKRKKLRAKNSQVKNKKRKG